MMAFNPKPFVLFLAFALHSSEASAYEVLQVCAEYVGTGEKYRVEANILDGMELNRETNSMSYSSLSKYVVIFWGPGEASVIELDFSFAALSMGAAGTDQGGYRWTISTLLTFCS